jgi:hypothetical protein
VDLDETELATLRKQVKDKVCAIATSKKQRNGKVK